MGLTLSKMRDWVRGHIYNIGMLLSPIPINYLTQKDFSSTSAPPSPTQFIPPTNWVNAPEFYPSATTASVSASDLGPDPVSASGPIPGNRNRGRLCDYAMNGNCRFGANCHYVHGTHCETCGRFALHPHDEVKRKKHIKKCFAALKKDMEYTFKVAESMEKECCICKAVVRKKQNNSGSRFGILCACNHCFCITCIRTWRKCKQYSLSIRLGCPVCRVVSRAVIASREWVENGKDKTKMFHHFLIRLRTLPCKKIKKGKCPFGAACFYKHPKTEQPASVVPQSSIQPGTSGSHNASATTQLFQLIIN